MNKLEIIAYMKKCLRRDYERGLISRKFHNKMWNEVERLKLNGSKLKGGN